MRMRHECAALRSTTAVSHAKDIECLVVRITVKHVVGGRLMPSYTSSIVLALTLNNKLDMRVTIGIRLRALSSPVVSVRGAIIHDGVR